jgi:hypothetical protein
MTIPAQFEFHFVQNGVKKSVTLFTALLFKADPPHTALRRDKQLRPIRDQRMDESRPL